MAKAPNTPNANGQSTEANKAETEKPAEPGSVTSQIAKNPRVNFGGVGHEVALAGGVVFKVKAQLTREVIKQKDNETIFVQITGPIYQGKTLDGAKKKADGSPEMAPARLCEVADLATGRLGLIIANKVLEGALVDAFPGITGAKSQVKSDTDNSLIEVDTPNYVGKKLAITMQPSPEGKRYKTFTVYELDETGA